MESRASPKRSKSRKREVKPKLSTNLKLLVAQAPFEERSYVNEVAEVLEEILNAAENGLERLPPRRETRVGNIINRVKMEEKLKEEAELKAKQERDRKFSKYQREVKERMEQRRLDKLQRDEEENKLEMQKRKSELEKQRKRDESRKRYLESQKNKLEQKRLQELEEIKQKRAAEEEKNREEAEKIKEEKRRFLKQQKDKLRKEFQQRVEERKQLENLKSEIEYEKMEKKTQIMENMVKYLNDHNAEDKELEKLRRDQINNFYESNYRVFEDYKNEINKIFNIYSKLNATTIDSRLENNINTLDMIEFVKFSKKSKIVPTLLNNQTLLYIYKILAKERMDNADKDDELGLVLDQHAFHKALILIAIEGRDILGGALKKKEETKMDTKARFYAESRRRSRGSDKNKSPNQKVKTLEAKKIKELEKNMPKYDTKIKDIKVSKAFDVSTISVDTVVSLINFISKATP